MWKYKAWPQKSSSYRSVRITSCVYYRAMLSKDEIIKTRKKDERCDFVSVRITFQFQWSYWISLTSFELKISLTCLTSRTRVLLLNRNEEIKTIKIFLVHANNCIINHLIYLLEYSSVVLSIDKFAEVLLSFVLVCSVALWLRCFDQSSISWIHAISCEHKQTSHSIVNRSPRLTMVTG